MMYLGDFAATGTVRLPFNTSAADGSSITIATDGTLKIYNLANLTQRTSASGVTFIEDHDTAGVGRHLISIALADDTDVGFYAAGNDFGVARDAMTIDGKTVNAWLGMFSIENRSALRPTTPYRTIDVFPDGSVTATSVSAPTPAEIANEVQTRTIAGVTAVGIVNDVAALVVTKHWAASSRTLTSFGTLVADVVSSLAASFASILTAIGLISPGGSNPSGFKKNTAVPTFDLVMESLAGVPLPGLTVTARRRLDSGAFASCANPVTEVSDGVYTVTPMAAADMNADKITFLFTAPLAKPLLLTIYTEP